MLERCPTCGKTTGTLMEAGSQLVMQVHYNLLATGGKAEGTDQSALRIRFGTSA